MGNISAIFLHLRLDSTMKVGDRFIANDKVNLHAHLMCTTKGKSPVHGVDSNSGCLAAAGLLKLTMSFAIK